MVPWHHEHQCFLHSWFIATLFQFSVIGIIMCALFSKWRRVTYLLTIALIIGSAVLNMIIAASAKIPISRGGSTRNEDDLMTKPWTSFQVFGSGMLLAFFYFEYRSQEVYESLRSSLGTSFLNIMKRLPSFIHFIFMILCAVCYVLLYIST